VVQSACEGLGGLDALDDRAGHATNNVALKVSGNRMMRLVVVGALLAVFSTSASAQAPALPASFPPPGVAGPVTPECAGHISVVYRPSVEPLGSMLRTRTDLPANSVLRPTLLFQIDADGVPSDIGIYASSQDKDVDAKSLEWGRGMRFSSAAGCPNRQALIPLVLVAESPQGEPAQYLEPTQAPPQPHTISANEMRVRPDLKHLFFAIAKSGIPSVATSVTLIYDATGKVTDLKLDKPTGSKPLDRAILEWARKIEINTHQPGGGTLQVRMSN